MKVAVVTGASRGLGSAFQQELLRLGYQVVSMSRTAPSDQGHEFCPLDLADETNIQAAASQVKKRWEEGIDLLVNCAGFGISGPFEETSPQEIRKQFDVNVFGAWELTRQLIPLLEKKRGRILFISSVAATIPIPFQSFYSVSKAAITHMSLCLDNELLPLGMRSLCVELGDISTTFTDHRQKMICSEKYKERCERSVMMMEKDERAGERPDKVAPKILKRALSANPPPKWTHGLKYSALSRLYHMLTPRISNGILRRLYG